MQIGKITPNGVSLEKHENDTVVFFTNLDHNIELIPPSNTPKAKIPTNQTKLSLEKLFKTSRRVRNLKVITREQQLLDFKK